MRKSPATAVYARNRVISRACWSISTRIGKCILVFHLLRLRNGTITRRWSGAKKTTSLKFAIFVEHWYALKVNSKFVLLNTSPTNLPALTTGSLTLVVPPIWLLTVVHLPTTLLLWAYPSTSVLGADSKTGIVGQRHIETWYCELSSEACLSSAPSKLWNIPALYATCFSQLIAHTMGKLWEMTTFDDKCCVSRNKGSGQAMALETVVNGLFAFERWQVNNITEKASVANLGPWHQRITALRMWKFLASRVWRVLGCAAVKGVAVKSDNTEHKCDGSIFGENHRTLIPHHCSKPLSSQNLLDPVHSELTRPRTSWNGRSWRFKELHQFYGWSSLQLGSRLRRAQNVGSK